MEARTAGRLMAEAGLVPDVLFTSVLSRATETADLAVREAGWGELPTRRSWRLNERHYGDLQGLDKKETAAKFGPDQVMAWRRSYDTPPPPLEPDDPRHPSHDDRYADVDPEDLPATECLADVVARMLPYWFDEIVPVLREGKTPLIVAHGNSLRALVKHLDDIGDDQIVDLNIPTGIPLVYELDGNLRPISSQYLGDPEAAQAAADAVGKQAG
jgi:2,3-bisphosphoglycerate-dependent phosphoglycerate mutase